jgi:hypothetical protein
VCAALDWCFQQLAQCSSNADFVSVKELDATGIDTSILLTKFKSGTEVDLDLSVWRRGNLLDRSDDIFRDNFVQDDGSLIPGFLSDSANYRKRFATYADAVSIEAQRYIDIARSDENRNIPQYLAARVTFLLRHQDLFSEFPPLPLPSSAFIHHMIKMCEAVRPVIREASAYFSCHSASVPLHRLNRFIPWKSFRLWPS